MTALTTVPIEHIERLSTGTRSFDDVLDGGLVSGSATLVVGESGIGKSMLVSQVAMDLAVARVSDVETKERVEALSVLFISTRARVSIVHERMLRIGQRVTIPGNLEVLRVPCAVLEDVVAQSNPDVLIVDSIDDIESARPTKEFAEDVVRVSKARGITCLCTASAEVGSLTKHEHLFDCTVGMMLEDIGVRALIATKNRFGDAGRPRYLRAAKCGFESVE